MYPLKNLEILTRESRKQLVCGLFDSIKISQTSIDTRAYMFFRYALAKSINRSQDDVCRQLCHLQLHGTIA